MARLIVIDASVSIAALSADDVHHRAAAAAIASLGLDDELVLAATTRTEILVGPCRAGGSTLQSARDFVDGCATIPVTATIADAAAALRANHSALSVPDAVALAVADVVGADIVWTFDQRWSTVDTRVTIPTAPPSVTGRSEEDEIGEREPTRDADDVPGP
jgi:predicted nucleic acid-binding protein